MSYHLYVYEGPLEKAFRKADEFVFDKYYDPDADYAVGKDDLRSLALMWWQIEHNSKIIFTRYNNYDWTTGLEFESETDAAWWVLRWS
jgi:hypothetical protein